MFFIDRPALYHPTPMLDHLDEIHWSKLSHAYGPASDVPGLLRDLLDLAACKNALHQLFGTIWHQGTVYPASAAAVPFLQARTIRNTAAEGHPRRKRAGNSWQIGGRGKP